MLLQKTVHQQARVYLQAVVTIEILDNEDDESSPTAKWYDGEQLHRGWEMKLQWRMLS